MKRFFANLIVLIIACAAIFAIGWVQFLVKPGFCGIMISKTGGIYQQVLVPGKFVWRWEKLLPTNVQILQFKTDLREIEKVFASENTNNDYSIKFTITLQSSPEDILKLVSDSKIKNQDDLDKLYDFASSLIAQEAAKQILDDKIGFGKDTKDLSFHEISTIQNKFSEEFKNISIIRVECTEMNIQTNHSFGGDSMEKRLYCIRGAVCPQNTPESIRDLVGELCSELFTKNKILDKDIVNIQFTITPDLNALNPASALRTSPKLASYDVSHIPLFCSQEPVIQGMLDRVIRVMVTVYLPEGSEIQPIYLGEAQNLRPDLHEVR